MRTFIFLFCVTAFALTPDNVVSQNSKIKIEKDKTLTVDEVFDLIMNQTKYKFFYEEGIFKSFPKVHVKKGIIRTNKLLKQSLSNGNLDVLVTENNAILIREKPLDTSITTKEVLQQEISGKVTDQSGQALPGTTVLVKGTTNGTQTDFDGNYTIKAAEGATLVFSYIGYTTQEVPVTSNTTINVTLLEDASQLDEVVIIGYGTQRKSDLTGSVGIIDGDDLGKFTSGNPTQALQGRVSGVRVTNNGGSPGAEAFVTIRGQSTLSSRGPLYVVDGLQTDNIQSLNPADIESVSVLKDASALAIYGSRAANGVIIVNTKTGKKGAIAIDLDVNFGFDKIINQIDFANARQYADYRNAANDNDGIARAPANDTQFNPNIDTDIQDASLRTAPTFNLNARFSGGGDNGSYSVSLNRFTQEGIVKESSLERNAARINTTFEKGRFKLRQNLNLTQIKREVNDFFNLERDHIPTAPIFGEVEGLFDTRYRATADPTGGIVFHGVRDVRNSLGQAQLQERLDTRNRVQGNIVASFEIIDGLTYELNAGIDYLSRNDFKFDPTYFFANAEASIRPFNTLDERNFNNLGTIVENTLTYSKEFNEKHRLKLLVGFTENRFESRSLGVVVNDFPNNDVRVASAGENVQQTPSELIVTGLQSYLGRLDYAFDDRYSITGTIRSDASSLFREELRRGNFISGAFAWNVINESFMEDQEVFDNFKLRASYGETGSNNVDAYSYRAVLDGTSNFIFGDSQTRLPGFAQIRGINSDLQWETTEITNIGLDLAFMDNRLQVETDYFIRDSRDIIVNLPPSAVSGFGNSPPANAASLRNKGFELLVNYRTKIGELNLNFGANFTTVKNEVLSLGENISPIFGGAFTSNGGRNTTRTDAGRPVGAFYVWRVLGIYQTDAEALADGRTDAGAGDFIFDDVDGNSSIGPEDRQYVGKPNPDFEYGLNIDGNYKNWDFSLFFNGVQGNDIINGSRWRFTFDTTSNYYAEVANSWTPTNTNTNIPRPTLLDGAGNARQSTYLLEDGSFFRLRNVQVGYTLPEKLTSVLKLSRARIYLSAANLFTITDYTGYDPEVGRNGRGNSINLFGAGVDERSYPSARSLQIGAQFSF